MKKIITLGLTTAMIATIGASTAVAASPARNNGNSDTKNFSIRDNRGTTFNYVDENGDGICDNTGLAIGQRSNQGFGIGKNGGRFADQDGDGVNDNIGSGNGGYFTDNDDDGECDNIGTRQGMNKNGGLGKGRNR